MRRKWSTTTAFPDASQTMPDTRKEHFFPFPEDEQQRKTLLRFLNRSDAHRVIILNRGSMFAFQ